jgi:hypothetical protein
VLEILDAPKRPSELDHSALNSWNYPQMLVQYGKIEIAQDNYAYFVIWDEWPLLLAAPSGVVRRMA